MLVKKGILVVSMLILSGCFGIGDKEALKEFQNRSGAFSVTVFPWHVVISDTIISDYELQIIVTDQLNEKGWCKGVTSDIDVSVPVVWGRNQAKMFKNSGIQFAEQVSKLNINTDYALLIESLSMGREENMGGVHFYLVNNQGKFVTGMLSNSHWDEFTNVNPKSRQDAVKVAFNLFEKAF